MILKNTGAPLMPDELPPEAIAVFLESLEKDDPADAVRAYRTWFIRTHAAAIARYIGHRLAEKGLTEETRIWSRNIHAQLDRHATGPKSCTFNPHTGAIEPLQLEPIRSFRLSNTHHSSLTIHDAGHPVARAVGYLLTLLVIAFVLWLGWKLAQSVIHHGEGWAQMIQTAAE